MCKILPLTHGPQPVTPTSIDGAANMVWNSMCLGLCNVMKSSGYRSSTAINVYPHFGEKDMWPRGFPLDLVRKQSTSNGFLRTEAKPLVLQVLNIFPCMQGCNICLYFSLPLNCGTPWSWCHVRKLIVPLLLYLCRDLPMLIQMLMQYIAWHSLLTLLLMTMPLLLHFPLVLSAHSTHRTLCSPRRHFGASWYLWRPLSVCAIFGEVTGFSVCFGRYVVVHKLCVDELVVSCFLSKNCKQMLVIHVSAFFAGESVILSNPAGCVN